MQPLAAGAKLAAYHRHLKSSHDFDIYVDVLNLNEVMTGSATFLDGQVNIESTGPVRRKATLTLSDPAGALDFSNASAWSGTTIWVDRIVRVRHVVNVPGYGEITAVPFIGPPTALARSGAEVQVECSDKAAMAMRGARPMSAVKGANAIGAIKTILSACTGEFRFRLPSHPKRCSRSYTVGLTDDAAPAVVASEIARNELGMQLLWSCDGYVMLRPLPTSPCVDVGWVTDVANANVDFTTLANYVQVVGGAVSKKVGVNTLTSRVYSSATVEATSSISPERLTRQGVPRLLPLVITEDAYKKTSQTSARAKTEISKAAALTDELSASVVPMFHLDADDMVTVHTTASGSRVLRLNSGSIPLGVGGDMTIGYPKWVSKVANPRRASWTHRVLTKPKPKTKGKHKPRKRRPRRHHG